MAFTVYFFTLVLLLDVLTVGCYKKSKTVEHTHLTKTLRKMVRSQSKMVQRPFSDKDGVWFNDSLSPWAPSKRNLVVPDSELLTNKVIHKLPGKRVSTPVMVDSAGSKSENITKDVVNVSMVPLELRHARDAYVDDYIPSNQMTNTLLFPPPPNEQEKNIINAPPEETVPVEAFYEIPNPSKSYLPTYEMRNEHIKDNENTIVIPDRHNNEDGNNAQIKRIFISTLRNRADRKKTRDKATTVAAFNNDEADNVDFLVQGTKVEPTSSTYAYNVSLNEISCTSVGTAPAYIDAQQQFYRFDIEPPWMSKRNFWSKIFDSRYEYLMRSPKWSPLRVILVPRTRVDSIWQKSFERYHNDTVNRIISNIVKKMQFYQNLTFTWNEVSHLSQWWISTSARSRLAFRRLVRGGRLEITTGGWVEPDEATTHLFGMVHQLIEGHQWLQHNLNYTPSVAWLTNSVAHSPTMAYLLSAAGINKLVITNLHYSWAEYLAEYQLSDFIWVQNWDQNQFSSNPLNRALNKIGNDRYPKHSVATHFLQFNSDSFQACGPNKAICAINFDFTKSNKILDVHSYNVKEKAELLLEQYSKSGTISQHNVIIAPIGDAYRFDSQSEFDYQYNNYQELANFINVNQRIYKASVEFGTPKDYFRTIFTNHKTYPTMKGDFLNYADLITGAPAYWTGYYTSRPMLKILLRRLESTLRSTEILFSLALSYNSFRAYYNGSLFDTLVKARHTVARLTDRNVMSGTLTANAVKYVYRLILATVKDCWHLQEVAASLLSVKTGKINVPYLLKYVYRDGEFMSPFRTIQPGDQIYVFNSLSHERVEVVELTVSNPNVIIIDHHKKQLTIQINPIWKYNNDNTFKISRRFFKVIFSIVVPPITLELFKVKSTYDASQNAATIYCVECPLDDSTVSPNEMFPFNIQPIEMGDIQLENYKHRLVFDEDTGFLKTVVEKTTNHERAISIEYGAFKSSNRNSGMFLFNTNVSKPIHDIFLQFRQGIKTKIVMIVTGQVTTELTNVYGTLLQQTIKIYNFMFGPLSTAIYIETKVDYEASPKNREIELFMSIQTDVGNGNPPEIFTDNNGFQYTSRLLNVSRRIESNMYPMTSMAFIQDRKRRASIITDHAQGVTSLQEGNMVVMLERRVLFNDGRGTDEGLADSTTSTQRHYLLLENFIEPAYNPHPIKNPLQLPSLSAVHLANKLSYVIDLFIVGYHQPDVTRYLFLPLVKTSFPCDVSLITYRVSPSRTEYVPNTALMVLHRQSISCNIEHSVNLFCNGDTDFSLDHILYNVKEIYQTNLVGTSHGVYISQLNQVNFPPMELTTLRIHF